MGRQENIAVFEHTKQLCGKHAKLKEAIQKSNAEQKFYPERKTAVEKELAEMCFRQNDMRNRHR